MEKNIRKYFDHKIYKFNVKLYLSCKIKAYLEHLQHIFLSDKDFDTDVKTSKLLFKKCS